MKSHKWSRVRRPYYYLVEVESLFPKELIYKITFPNYFTCPSLLLDLFFTLFLLRSYSLPRVNREIYSIIIHPFDIYQTLHSLNNSNIYSMNILPHADNIKFRVQCTLNVVNKITSNSLFLTKTF